MTTVAAQAALHSLPAVLKRADLMPALESAARASRGSSHALAVIALDVDNFKPYQDEVGAARAEQVLTQLALLLGQLKPATASLAYLGADEFILILPDHGLKAAAALAERLRERIKEALSLLDCQPPLTATLGVAASPTGEDWSAATLLALADNRMSFAKKRLQPHHDLVYAGALPSDWNQRLEVDPARWPAL